MAGIEFVAVFTVTTFNLAVVARSIRAKELVPDSELRSGCLEQRRLVFYSLNKMGCELGTVSGLFASHHISRNISLGIDETAFLVLYFS